MRVKFVAYEGRRQNLEDFCLLLVPETDFEEQFITALLEKALPRASLTVTEGTIGILISKGEEVSNGFRLDTPAEA